MKNFLEVSVDIAAGSRIQHVVKDCIQIAHDYDCQVSFRFNDIKFSVFGNETEKSIVNLYFEELARRERDLRV